MTAGDLFALLEHQNPEAEIHLVLANPMGSGAVSEPVTGVRLEDGCLLLLSESTLLEDVTAREK